MNITNLKRLDINYESGRPSHAIYINPKDATMLVLQPLIKTTDRDLMEASNVFGEAIKKAIEDGISSITIPFDFDIKVINFGDRDERLKEMSKDFKSI